MTLLMQDAWGAWLTLWTVIFWTAAAAVVFGAALGALAGLREFLVWFFQPLRELALAEQVKKIENRCARLEEHAVPGGRK